MRDMIKKMRQIDRCLGGRMRVMCLQIYEYDWREEDEVDIVGNRRLTIN